jgi:hypothetical protein
MGDPNETQIGGQHYREANSAYQHWDLVADYGLNYFLGVMTKYVCRWHKKNGLQDLEKAKHYLQKFMFLVQEGRMSNFKERRLSLELAKKFCKEQNLSEVEREIIMESITCRDHIARLMYINAKIDELIQEAKRD